MWRKVQDSFVYNNMELLGFWVHLLLKANHKDTEFIFNGEKQSCNRGQVIIGRSSIASETKLSGSKTYRFLKLLENGQLIEQQKTNKFSLVTIPNYQIYQGGEQQSEQQVNNKRTTSEQQVNTSKECKECKNDKNDKNKNKNDNNHNNNNNNSNSNNIATVINDIPEDWRELFISWLEYKKERKQAYRSKNSALIAYKHLLELSGGSLTEARFVVQQSIANNWAGLFGPRGKVPARDFEGERKMAMIKKFKEEEDDKQE